MSANSRERRKTRVKVVPRDLVKEYCMIIDGKAFLGSYDSAPRPPPSPISNLSVFLRLSVCRRSSLLTGEKGKGLGVEPNQTTARKLDHLYIIQYSLVLVDCSVWEWGVGWRGGGGGTLKFKLKLPVLTILHRMVGSCWSGPIYNISQSVPGKTFFCFLIEQNRRFCF
jgi:hypothetical protein